MYTQLSEPKPSAKLIAKYRHAFQWINTKIASTTYNLKNEIQINITINDINYIPYHVQQHPRLLTLQIRNAFGYPVAVSVRSNHSSIRGRRNKRLIRTITGHGTCTLQS